MVCQAMRPTTSGSSLPHLTELHLNVQLLSFFPGLEELDTVGMMGQLLVFFHLHYLPPTIRLPFEMMVRSFHGIPPTIVLTNHLEHFSKRSLPQLLLHSEALFKVGPPGYNCLGVRYTLETGVDTLIGVLGYLAGVLVRLFLLKLSSWSKTGNGRGLTTTELSPSISSTPFTAPSFTWEKCAVLPRAYFKLSHTQSE